MPCLPSWKITALKARRDKLVSQLDLMDTTIDSAIESGRFTSLELDSGEGKEKSVYRSLSVLIKSRDALENELTRVLNKLTGRGVVNLGLKRINGCNF